MPSYIQEGMPLGALTTLGVGGPAEYYARVKTVEQLQEATQWAQSHALPVMVLGGGSNVLVPDLGVRGLVIALDMKDIESIPLADDVVELTVGAGMLLDTVIEFSVENGWWGLENLSGIPGTIGAVPIQNVGAYGVEVRDVIQRVHVFNTETHEREIFTNDMCVFAYRDSIFKKEIGKKYIITHVTFACSKKAEPRIAYKDVKNFFGEKINPSLVEIREAILHIRSAKFPDWTRIGTAGSFFKNPIITESAFLELQKKYPDLPGYNTEGGIKISLGWILDHVCHLRGKYDEYGIGLYEHQALVLVCPHGVAVKNIEHFYKSVIEKVFDATSIRIELEVTIL